MSSIINSYNRPNYPYRCGRAALWGKPCAFGPNFDGSCGGITACTPRKNGDRYICNRRPENGGSCDQGPLPDGSCCLTQVACQPRRTLRAIRYRLCVSALVIIVAILGAFGVGGSIFSNETISLKNPGKLSNAHLSVVDEGSCVSCHDVHDANVVGAIKAVFNPSGPTSKGIENKCLACHEFPLMNASVHNSKNCSTCHSEHKGGMKPPSKISDEQCHSCHDQTFTTFGESHPNFGKTYPYERRTAINFDHNAHINTHFKDKRYKNLVPEGRCISCHAVSSASKAVPIKSFQDTCAACHEDEIKTRTLTLFQLPEFETKPDFGKEIDEFCGPNKVGPTSEEEYESVSVEELNPIMSFLLEVDGTESGSYEKRVTKLISSVVTSNVEAFKELLLDHDGIAKNLIAGLTPQVLSNAICSWVANKEYEPSGDAKFGGWSADELTIKYEATQHGDKTMMNWLNFAAMNDDDVLSGEILHKDGAGGCIKCHSVSETDEVRVEWKAASGINEPSHHKYSHAPHLNVLGPGSQCETCHKLNPSAKYSSAYKQRDPSIFESSFAAINENTCKNCHNDGQVVQACLTCHEYHKSASFKAKMLSTAAKSSGNSLASRDEKQ